MAGFKPGMNPGATIFSGIFINQVVDLGLPLNLDSYRLNRKYRLGIEK